MIRLIIILISLQFSFTACNDRKQASPPARNYEISPLETIDTEESEYGYSDSIINELIVNSLPKPILIIDTLESILSADCTLIDHDQTYHLTESDIEKYDTELPVVSDQLKKLLGVTHCFSHIETNEHYTLNVYYNQQNESHYSASLELISIHKTNYKISKLILARIYRNEQGDIIISSTMDEKNTIKRKFMYNYRYIHGIGKVDSSSVNFEEFSIDPENGEIIYNE